MLAFYIGMTETGVGEYFQKIDSFAMKRSLCTRFLDRLSYPRYLKNRIGALL